MDVYRTGSQPMPPRVAGSLHPRVDIDSADDPPLAPQRSRVSKSRWEKSRDRMTIVLLVIALTTAAAVFLATDEILSAGSSPTRQSVPR